MTTDTTERSTAVEAPDYGFWREHTTIALSPVAAPSILGLFGFAAATFMVAANLAGWYGNTSTPLVLFPFALAAGGVAQLLAGMWAYRARDAVATAMHGIWGAFWIGYGLYNLLIALGVLPAAAVNATAAGAFGFWFVVLAAITVTGAIAASRENAALTAVLATLAIGAALLAVALLAAVPVVQTIAAYVLLVSALLAWYVGSALMFEATFKRAVLPVGKRAAATVPDALPRTLIQYEAGEPGVKAGQ